MAVEVKKGISRDGCIGWRVGGVTDGLFKIQRKKTGGYRA
jgi:hypothetical protein